MVTVSAEEIRQIDGETTIFMRETTAPPRPSFYQLTGDGGVFIINFHLFRKLLIVDPDQNWDEPVRVYEHPYPPFTRSISLPLKVLQESPFRSSLYVRTVLADLPAKIGPDSRSLTTKHVLDFALDVIRRNNNFQSSSSSLAVDVGMELITYYTDYDD